MREIRNAASRNGVSTIGDKKIWLWAGNLSKALQGRLPQWIQSDVEGLTIWIDRSDSTLNLEKTIVWAYHKLATAYRILFHISIYRRGSIEYQGVMPQRSIQAHFRQVKRSEKANLVNPTVSISCISPHSQ